MTYARKLIEFPPNACLRRGNDNNNKWKREYSFSSALIFSVQTVKALFKPSSCRCSVENGKDLKSRFVTVWTFCFNQERYRNLTRKQSFLLTYMFTRYMPKTKLLPVIGWRLISKCLLWLVQSVSCYARPSDYQGPCWWDCSNTCQLMSFISAYSGQQCGHFGI